MRITLLTHRQTQPQYRGQQVTPELILRELETQFTSPEHFAHMRDAVCERIARKLGCSFEAEYAADGSLELIFNFVGQQSELLEV